MQSVSSRCLQECYASSTTYSGVVKKLWDNVLYCTVQVLYTDLQWHTNQLLFKSDMIGLILASYMFSTASAPRGPEPRSMKHYHTNACAHAHDKIYHLSLIMTLLDVLVAYRVLLMCSSRGCSLYNVDISFSCHVRVSQGSYRVESRGRSLEGICCNSVSTASPTAQAEMQLPHKHAALRSWR